VVGLPDRPVVMGDLNLEAMMVPRCLPMVQATGMLKVQLSADKESITVIIVEVHISLLILMGNKLSLTNRDGDIGMVWIRFDLIELSFKAHQHYFSHVEPPLEMASIQCATGVCNLVLLRAL
jgi:hypothetical protein